MIIVSVILISANTGQAQEIARMQICNTGAGTATHGDYEGKTFIGRSTEALARNQVSRTGSVENFPRQSTHVWNLVVRILKSMGYR